MSVHNFEDLFGFEFGKQTKKSVSLESVDGIVDVEFMTPANSEEDVRFFISTTAFVSDKTKKLQIMYTGQVLFEDSRSLSMFVNKSGIDPKPLKVRDDTNNGQEYEVPRETHLMPNTKYVFRMIDNSNPTGFYYSGTDTDDVEEYGMPMSYEGVDGTWFPND